jgi:hypothetical protein
MEHEDASARVPQVCHCSGGMSQKQKSPTPTSPKPLKSCCRRLDTLAKPNVEKFTRDVGQEASVSVLASDLPLIDARGEALQRLHLLSPPIRLINCVWLC